MKPGVLRQLNQRRIAQIAARQPELDGKNDLVGFAYTDRSAALRYAERNRARGFTVVGPIQPGQGGSWVNVIVLDDIPAMQPHRRQDDQDLRGAGGTAPEQARCDDQDQLPPAG